MNEFKGTPGPWYAEYNRANNAYEIAPMDKNGITLAWDKEICITADDSAENAQVIAAAPELLEALQDLVSRCRIYVNTSDAQAAIAKALGETK